MPIIDLPSARIHYLEAGSGQPLLLLSANPGTGRDFEAVIPELSRHYRVIAPDWPGYGGSEPRMPPEAVSADHFLAVFGELVAALGLSTLNILGNSVGGNVAVRYALAHPEQVRSLVLVSPGGFTPHNGLTRAFCRWMGSRFGLPPSWFARLYLRRRNAVIRDMLHRARTKQSAGAALAVNRAIWRSFLHPEHDLRARARALAMPVQLVFGRYDPVISPWLDGRAARRAIPHATRTILPCGHAPFAELPEAFLSRVLPFLASVAGSANAAVPGATGSGEPG